MRQYRLSASLLLVAVLAVDLAVARRAFQGGGPAAGEVRELASLFGPMALSLQFGFWRALGGRREDRPFWTGFLAGGLLVVGWFGVAILTRAPALLAPLTPLEPPPKPLPSKALPGGWVAAKLTFWTGPHCGWPTPQPTSLPCNWPWPWPPGSRGDLSHG